MVQGIVVSETEALAFPLGSAKALAGRKSIEVSRLSFRGALVAEYHFEQPATTLCLRSSVEAATARRNDLRSSFAEAWVLPRAELESETEVLKNEGRSILRRCGSFGAFCALVFRWRSLSAGPFFLLAEASSLPLPSFLFLSARFQRKTKDSPQSRLYDVRQLADRSLARRAISALAMLASRPPVVFRRTCFPLRLIYSFSRFTTRQQLATTQHLLKTPVQS